MCAAMPAAAATGAFGRETLGLSPVTLIGLVTGVWLVGAAWAVARSIRWASEARLAGRANARLKALVAAAPAAYLLVSRDRKTASSASLLPLMGLSAEPQSLHDLHGLDDRKIGRASWRERGG